MGSIENISHRRGQTVPINKQVDIEPIGCRSDTKMNTISMPNLSSVTKIAIDASDTDNKVVNGLDDVCNVSFTNEVQSCSTRTIEKTSMKNMLLNLSRERRLKKRNILREIEDGQDNQQHKPFHHRQQANKTSNGVQSQFATLLHDKLLVLQEDSERNETMVNEIREDSLTSSNNGVSCSLVSV